jgi:hypothetical protein
MGEVDWEQDWLQASSAIHLFARAGRLGIARTASGRRQLRLLACALCRCAWDQLDKDARAAVIVAEQYADGRATEADLARAHDGIASTITGKLGASLPRPNDSSFSQRATEALRLARAVFWTTSRRNVREIAENVYADISAVCRLSSAFSAGLIRCLLGNPYRPVALPRSILSRNDGTCLKLARVMDEARDFQSMGILADALEEAGCTDAAVLAHCRRPGPHAHGCHVLEAVLALGRRGACLGMLFVDDPDL